MAERVTEIYSLLVPLLDGRLIVPRACVAEVVGYQAPTEMPGAPPWYLGTVEWGAAVVFHWFPSRAVAGRRFRP